MGGFIIRRMQKLHKWETYSTFPVLERKGGPPAFGWWGKVDCCMLEQRGNIVKALSIIYIQVIYRGKGEFICQSVFMERPKRKIMLDIFVRQWHGKKGILWRCYLQKYPVRFYRQYAIGQYIADFYCRQAKLVIELDGSQHFMEAGEAYDQRRTAYMERFGIQVLRFTNKEILSNLYGVCEYIDLVVKNRLKKLQNSWRVQQRTTHSHWYT